EKIRRSNQDLEQFAFIASHDLQEPLRKIVMFGNSLRNQIHGKVDDTAENHLARMQNAAERMQTMINGLLELSRINSRGGNFSQINLNRVVGDAVSDLEARIRIAGAQVIIGDLPSVEADEMQMRLLFQNLIGNAVKFRKPDAQPVVTVSAKADHHSGRPQQIEIKVEDNGIGFQQEHTERIFQPFQRLHGRSAYEGSGLGLAICRKIVERHHGTITAHSLPGRGSTFVISLPVTQAASDMSAARGYTNTSREPE
ncbi:MAG: ATP-binding protein, partial [Anaerolineaceae bacterium]